MKRYVIRGDMIIPHDEPKSILFEMPNDGNLVKYEPWMHTAETIFKNNGTYVVSVNSDSINWVKMNNQAEKMIGKETVDKIIDDQKKVEHKKGKS